MTEPKKSLGQHWLHDETSLLAMCDAADLQSTDTVLEIGPGLGTLTKKLVTRVSKVIAVEYDDDLAKQLVFQQIANNLQIERSDIRRFNFTNVTPGYKVVANIPYYLTSHLIQLLSESTNPPEIAVLLVQKEVAERVAAKSGDMSLLSVSAQYYWDVSLDLLVPARLFTPPPKVDSQILIMKRRSTPLFNDVDEKQFFQIIKAGFASKRKTLLNSLSGGLRLAKPETNELLEQAEIDPGTRAQNLSLDEWHRLYQSIYKN